MQICVLQLSSNMTSLILINFLFEQINEELLPKGVSTFKRSPPVTKFF